MSSCTLLKRCVACSDCGSPCKPTIIRRTQRHLSRGVIDYYSWCRKVYLSRCYSPFHLLYPIELWVNPIVVSRCRECKRRKSPEKGIGISILKQFRKANMQQIVSNKVYDFCKRRGFQPYYLGRHIGRLERDIVSRVTRQRRGVIWSLSYVYLSLQHANVCIFS